MGAISPTLNTSIRYLMTFAYGVHAQQILDGPEWIYSEKFDLAGIPDETGRTDEVHVKLMLQKLLAERFRLAFHHSQKELTVYAITVARTGAKLRQSGSGPKGCPDMGFHWLGNFTAKNTTIAEFAGLMQSAVMDRPVVDKTELTGRFDFTLNWRMR